jgi:hypothetical protein
MAQRQKGSTRINAAAEIVGRRLAQVAERLGALKAQRPDPLKAAAAIRRRSVKLIKEAARSAKAAVAPATNGVDRTPKAVPAAKRQRKALKGLWDVTPRPKAGPREAGATEGASRAGRGDYLVRRQTHSAARGRRRQARRDKKS